MANILIDSLANPVRFYERDPVRPAQYFTRWFDTWQFCKTIQPWEQSVCFFQPWGNDDPIRLQYTSNFLPIILRLYNEKGELMIQQNCNTYQQDQFRPTFYIRQAEVDLTPYPPGYYFMTREAAGVLTYSDPFEILEDLAKTTLFEYSNDEPYQELKFFVPFSPAIRVPGIFKYDSPGLKNTIYVDQLLNVTMVNSVPYRLWEFILGGEIGVPPWFIDKVSRIFGCRTLKGDGRLFTVNEGAGWEKVELESYPLAGYSIEMRETLNREAITTENEVVVEGARIAALIMDNYKAVGLGDNNGNDYQEINYVQ